MESRKRDKGNETIQRSQHDSCGELCATCMDASDTGSRDICQYTKHGTLYPIQTHNSMQNYKIPTSIGHSGFANSTQT